MPRLNHHAVRVIAPANDVSYPQPATSDRRGRRIDYAALLRRARVPQQREDAAEDEAPAQDERTAQSGAPGASGGSDSGGRGPDPTLAERIGTLSAPIIEAVCMQQQHFLDLSRRIAGEIAAFCANPSVGRAGSWDVMLPLDPDVLSGTLLLVSLSPVCLSLRFDVNDGNTRQLLLQHRGVLERELISLLDAWGVPRELDITIW